MVCIVGVVAIVFQKSKYPAARRNA